MAVTKSQLLAKARIATKASAARSIVFLKVQRRTPLVCVLWLTAGPSEKFGRLLQEAPPNKKAPGCPGARSLSASYLLFHFQTNRDFVDFALPCCLHRRRLVFASQLIWKWTRTLLECRPAGRACPPVRHSRRGVVAGTAKGVGECGRS